MSRLPSLSTLQLLAAAVADKSVSRAARRLGMTQSAASRRLAAFEAELGVSLFERHRRGVEPTAQASRYLAEVVPAIERIGKATDELRALTAVEPLRLRVYVSFAGKWLLPRLPEFQSAYPKVDVKLDTTVAPVNFERDEVDLAIQFGNGRWAGCVAYPLIRDRIEPVCTAAFARANRLDEATTSLAGLRLLRTQTRRKDWADWAHYSRLSLDGAAWMEMPISLLAYQAALEGMGLAMGETRLLSNELANGSLVAPFGRPLARDTGYYLVAPRRAAPRRSRLFREWIYRLTQWEE
jgi:LysR family glycine cleavage system transcriptional activator